MDLNRKWPATAWADAFGTWHARVTVTGVGGELGALTSATQVVYSELRARVRLRASRRPTVRRTVRVRKELIMGGHQNPDAPAVATIPTT